MACGHNTHLLTHQQHSHRSRTRNAKMDMDLVHNDTEVDVMRQDPEPQPVVDAEPEEEGPRMTRLRGILSKSLQETLKACNYNAIQECFPILATTNPDELHEAHEKVCQFLKVEVEVCLYSRVNLTRSTFYSSHLFINPDIIVIPFCHHRMSLVRSSRSGMLSSS